VYNCDQLFAVEVSELLRKHGLTVVAIHGSPEKTHDAILERGGQWLRVSDSVGSMIMTVGLSPSASPNDGLCRLVISAPRGLVDRLLFRDPNLQAARRVENILVQEAAGRLTPYTTPLNDW